jgi:hypothetical protein
MILKGHSKDQALGTSQHDICVDFLPKSTVNGGMDARVPL